MKTPFIILSLLIYAMVITHFTGSLSATVAFSVFYVIDKVTELYNYLCTPTGIIIVILCYISYRIDGLEK